MKNIPGYLGVAFVAIIVGVIVIFAGTFKYRMEASSYNRLCRPAVKATTWDAMWVHLRVNNCNK